MNSWASGNATDCDAKKREASVLETMQNGLAADVVYSVDAFNLDDELPSARLQS